MTWGWDVKRSCWPSWYCFCTFFLNYMCHLISFVGLVLAIVRGVAPVSTIELARKEKKVLACMCRFRSSSVVLSLDLIPELRHSWNTFLSLSSGWHPESPCGWTGSWRGKPRSGNILYIYLYQKHLTCLLLYYLSLFNGKWSSLIRSFFSSSATFSQSKNSKISQNMPLWLELNLKLYVLLSWHFHKFRSFASFCTLSSQILHSLLANDTVLLLQFPSYIILIQMKMNLFPPPF